MSTPELLGAEVAHDEWILRCLFLSGIVILAYDHVLTFGSEVKYIWTSGRRRSAVCCYKLTVAHGILLIVQELFVGCTLIMRVLAMYGFDKRVVITLVFAEILQLAVGTWALVPHGPPPPDDSPLPGCHTPNSRAQDMRMVVAWESQLAGDLILLGFTLYSGYTRSRGAIFPPGSLLRVLVRDGTMYFGIICIANFANTIMYYLDDQFVGIDSVALGNDGLPAYAQPPCSRREAGAAF
ncbi:hypothetical protein FB451DRAFT_115669 [Mycena latifolia]|nr:hypothetical protein FB451DRAFT_115669 [Mycena latifolia]